MSGSAADALPNNFTPASLKPKYPKFGYLKIGYRISPYTASVSIPAETFMPRSQFSDGYRAFISVLIQARKEAGLTQTELGQRIGRKQTFISIIETGVRRVDVVEFCALAKAMGYSPQVLFGRVAACLPDQLVV
jgi:DNA-binding XRE family transcriptional regulator